MWVWDMGVKKKKLYLVSREVLATSIKEALVAKGVVCSVQLASENNQPEEKKKIGFNKKDDDK